MPVWLIQLIPMVWKFLKHWGVYILLTVILVGGPYLLYQKGYNNGYKSRVCPPTYTVGAGGVINTYSDIDYRIAGIRIKLLWLNLRLGY